MTASLGCWTPVSRNKCAHGGSPATTSPFAADKGKQHCCGRPVLLRLLFWLSAVAVLAPWPSVACSIGGGPGTTYGHLDRPLIFLAQPETIKSGQTDPMYKDPSSRVKTIEFKVERYIRGSGPMSYVYVVNESTTSRSSCDIDLQVTPGHRYLIFEFEYNREENSNLRRASHFYTMMIKESADHPLPPFKNSRTNYQGLLEALEAGWFPRIEYDEFVKTKR